jgi:hypothetical protein
MKNKLTKNIYWFLLVASFLAINAFILYGIGAALSYLNTGADKSSMLHLEAPMGKVYAPKVTWGNIANPGRPMEKPTLQEIQRDYLNAWHVRNIAFKKNDRYGISDFYTDSARARVFEHIDLNIENNNWFKGTSLEHFPELDFYSEDGTLVVFTDKEVERYQEVYEGDELIFKEKDTTSYQIMMLLEDGFWRIRHLQEIETEKIKRPAIDRDIDTILQTVKDIKGINYYPQKTPWDTFGKKFNDTIIGKDFSVIKNMGLNTIRIFIQYEDFGKADVKLEKLERLKKTMDLALENDLKVMITLFDFYGDYDITNWTLTHRHAEKIVNALKDHPALLGWDIKNEPDLDFDSRGTQRVLSWLREMNSKIKQWDTNHPITIGWSSPEAAVHMADEVDFVSYHFYRGVDEFLSAHNELKSVVTNKPLVLQEYGYSSYNGFWNMYLGSDEQQVDYYKTMQGELADAGIPFIFWTLYDFEEVPTDVAGSLPWRTRKQHYFGCIDLDGNRKEVFKILKQ